MKKRRRFSSFSKADTEETVVGNDDEEDNNTNTDRTTRGSWHLMAKSQKNLAELGAIERIAQKKSTHDGKRFKVIPDDQYPDTYMNPEELRREMNKKSSYFHELDTYGDSSTAPCDGHAPIGEVRLEILQCFGLPASSASLLREVSAYCIAVCGPYAFKTDTMPPVANPMWLARMRRACVIPIHHGFARLYIGCLDKTTSTDFGASTDPASDFMGRIVVDIARLRHMSTYDVTLPFRQSAHVFEGKSRGSIRIRMHLQWNSERAMVLSYLPKSKPKLNKPYDNITINCVDDKAFRDVALVVHGKHMPGRFSLNLLQATVREVNFTQIHIMRYLQKGEIYNLRHYIHPFLSGFVFLAWMHCVYCESLRYVPGHFITYILLHMWKNYANYHINSKRNNGFLAPTFEELFSALVWGSKERQQTKRYCIDPLTTIVDKSDAVTPTNDMDHFDDDETIDTESIPLSTIADSMRKSVVTHTHTYRGAGYNKCFLGNEAVDFLVTFGYAYSREEAVRLGRRLAREAKLFEHVGEKEEFDDKPLRYCFLQYDGNKYIIQGHEPQGKTLFKAIGFLDSNDSDNDSSSKQQLQQLNSNKNSMQVPFPYGSGEDHPRFTVQESLVVRTTKGKEMLKERQNNNNNLFQKVLEGGDSKNNNNIENDNVAALEASAEFVKEFSEHFTDYDGEGDFDEITEKQERGVIMEEKLLKPPPSQDMRVKLTKGDKKLPETMEEARFKANKAMFHLFDIRTYKIDKTVFPSELKPDNTVTTTRTTIRPNNGEDIPVCSNHNILTKFVKKKINKRKKGSTSPESSNFVTCRETVRPYKRDKTFDQRKNECDKLLSMKQSNPMLHQFAVVLQPLLEIAQMFLYALRAIFNVFTWQDPIMSFWVVVLGPVLVILLHFAPWRIGFGVAGIAFIGPQNWIVRLWKQRNGTYEPPNFDRTIKKKEQEKESDWDNFLYFSKAAPGYCEAPTDARNVKQVIVPYTKLNFNSRFYDWPPEKEYAKVYKSLPPTNDINPSRRGDDTTTTSASQVDNNNNNNSTHNRLPGPYQVNEKNKKKSRSKVSALAAKIAQKVFKPTRGNKKNNTGAPPQAVKGVGRQDGAKLLRPSRLY